MNDKPLAYETYQQFADAYAAMIDTKPHNAYYDRPAMISLWPDLCGRRVLDAGCGPGAYAEALVDRGAEVVACDVSERMLEITGERLNGAVELQCVNLERPLTMFESETFDLINAPLCLDYIADWPAVFGEFARILKPGGLFVYSCGHPAFDAEYFDTRQYFSVERVECVWQGFGKDVLMPSFRRSLEETLMPVIHAGMIIDRVHEPLPTDDFKAADPVRYASLMHRPGFLCVRARKPQ